MKVSPSKAPQLFPLVDQDGCLVRDDLSLTSPELKELPEGTMVNVLEVVLAPWTTGECLVVHGGDGLMMADGWWMVAEHDSFDGGLMVADPGGFDDE